MLVLEVKRVLELEKRLEEMDPRVDGNYVLSAPRYDKCTACNICIDVCPVGAIKIDVPKQEREHVKREKWI
jgi:ferredoxin